MDAPALPSPWFRRIALLALVFNYLIVLTGATVRLTGSGLGCPNWPSCTDARTLPEVQYHALIEFFNRMVSTPTLLFSVAALVLALRMRPRRRDLRVGTAMVVALVLLQVVLGALTVIMELHPLIVSVHFIVSIAILGFATFVVFASRRPALAARGARGWLPGLMLASTAFVVIITGVLTTAAGPHSGGEAANGGALDRFGDAQLAVTVHARLVYVFAVLVVVVTLWQRRSRRGIDDLGVLVALVAVQVGLGEFQYRNGLPWEVVLAHVATACLVWIQACRIALGAATRAAAAPETPSGPPDNAVSVTGQSYEASEFDTVGT